MSRNPSEMARIEEEYEYAVSKFILAKTKSAKETLLREIRQLEKQLGIENSNYNSSDFTLGLSKR